MTAAYPRHTCLNDSCQVAHTPYTALYLWNSQNFIERNDSIISRETHTNNSELSQFVVWTNGPSLISW